MLVKTSTSRGELPDAVLAEITALGSFDCTRSSASPMILFRSKMTKVGKNLLSPRPDPLAAFYHSENTAR